MAEPTTEARAAFKRAELHRSHFCAECQAEAVAAERARIRMVSDWLNDPEWPRFGPGIGVGSLDPGRMAARAAVQQVLDALRES
jgi:hypothetical protein